MMNSGKISNELTSLYKYILPPILLVMTLLFLTLIIAYKVYLFIPIIIIFLIYFIIVVRILLKLCTLALKGDCLVILNVNGRENQLNWSNIKNIKKSKLPFFIKITTVKNKVFYFIPKMEYLFSIKKLITHLKEMGQIS